MPGPPSPDRHLLFGGLAVQMGFISRDQLLEALSAWGPDGAPSLADWLRRRGWLSPDSSAALDRLVERHLARAGPAPARTIPVDATPSAVDTPSTSLLDAMPPPPSSAKASRYRPVRAHARGGLGEVYLAMDAELDREVALREIQPQYAYQPQARARFLREAQITGRLEHPGVVPVYGLGSYGDGRPYYAMRFIKGESLQDGIKRFHAQARAGGEWGPGLRSLLGRFVAVCNAVGYAHSRGIIHRDLKPGNVMLGEYGETLVVDWGLAKALDQEDTEPDDPVPAPPGATSARTELGEAVGTPAYMAPEQARGELNRVDQRSDVFALGATLYHLLTGRAPYQGDLISTLAGAAEASAPAARRVNPRVPAALSAVCAKAMAAAPEGRYSTAKELAEEVERFLADEPVGAYRDPLTVRAGRWARRHRVLVSSLAVLLVAGVIGLAAGLYAVGREQSRTAEALKQSKGNEARAKDNELRALHAEALAKKNLERAEANLKLAKKAVDDCFSIAKDEPALQGEGLREVRQLLFEKARPFYEQFRAQRPDDPATREEMADHLFALAHIENQIGRKEKALELLEQVEALLVALAASQPREVGRQRELADVYHNLAFVRKDLGQHERALAALQQAQAINARLVAAYPKELRYRHRLAMNHNNLGTLLLSQGKYPEALRELEQTVGHYEKLAATQPDMPEHQAGLAGAHLNLGRLRQDQGRGAEALRAYLRARDAFRQLVADHPATAVYADDLALAAQKAGRALSQTGRSRDALAAYQEAVDTARRLAALHPRVAAYQSRLADGLAEQGIHLFGMGRSRVGMEALLAARDLHARLVARHPGVPEHRSKLAGAYNNVGNGMQAMDRFDEARRALHEAERLGAGLVADHPGAPAYQSELATTCSNLGGVLAESGKPHAAVRAIEKARDLRVRLVAASPGVFDYRSGLATAYFNLGHALRDAGRRDEGRRAFTEAIRLVNQFHAEGRRDGQSVHQLFYAHYFRALILGEGGRHRQALPDWDRVVALAPGPLSWRARLRRAEARARAGEHGPAAREAESLGPGKGSRAADRYDLARVFALCAAAARGDGALPLPVRERLAEAHARRAVGLLEEAAAAGYFRDRRARSELERNADLDALRGRADFRALLAE